MKLRHLLTAAAAALTASAGAATAADGDPERGEQVFQACQACHVADDEQMRVGPHLVELFGRPAGGVDGFNYSEAMTTSDVVWDEDTLDRFLADPDGYIPGNRMPFPGIRDGQDRADVIAYLADVTR